MPYADKQIELEQDRKRKRVVRQYALYQFLLKCGLSPSKADKYVTIYHEILDLKQRARNK